MLHMDLNILDALERVVASPHASHCWLALRRAIGASASPQAGAQLVQRLTDEVAAQPLPQFYRAMMLDVLTGDPQYLCAAARLLPALLPHDADRLSVFFSIAWQRSLFNAPSLSAYSARLTAIGLPHIAGMIDAVVGAALAPAPPVRPRGAVAGPLQRVAVLAPLLLSPAHPPTRMVLDMVEVLISLGYDIALFSANDAQVPDSEQLVGNGLSFAVGATDLAGWLQSLPVAVTVHSCDSGYSVRRRCHDLLPAMVGFNPDAVLFVGLYSPMATLAGQRWPLLAMATSSVAPMVRSDVWLTARQALHGLRAATWGGALVDQLACYYPFRRTGDSARRAARAHAPVSGIVRLVSMGNVLPARMQGPWAQRMVQLLRDYPQVRWDLVGGEGSVPPALASAPPGQIRAVPHVADLAPHWRASDILINPPGIGGGIAVAEAMDAGLAVVAFADTDGGDKLGADAVHTLDDYLALCVTLITDAEQRGTLSRRLAQRFDQHLDLAQGGPALREALALAQRRFHGAAP